MLSQAEIKLTDFIQNISWDKLLPEVKEKALLCLMDSLGSALIGTQAICTRTASESVSELFPGDVATMIYMGQKTSPVGAAFANGVSANALDIDDSGIYTWGHPGAQILASGLALGEAQHESGKKYLSASVVGYEVMFRAGRCWYDRDPFLRACGSWGSLGCTAVASHLMELTADQILHAFGIAEFHSPSLPLMKSVEEPTMVKHGIGIGAFTGIMSSNLAKHGFTGITSLFSLDEYQEWVGDIGDNYVLPHGICWKNYSCCAWVHPAIIGVKKLLNEGSIVPKEIKRIYVEVYEAASHLGVDLPETTEEAQFNLAWPIAALIVDGEVGPNQVLEPRLIAEEIRTIASRIELSISDELTKWYELAEVGHNDGKDAAFISIELIDGTIHDAGLSIAPTYSDQIWGRSEMENKFRWLLDPIIPEPELSDLVAMIWSFDQLDDIAELMNLISGLKLGIDNPVLT